MSSHLVTFQEDDGSLPPLTPMPPYVPLVLHHCRSCDNGEMTAGHCVDIDGDRWHVCEATLTEAEQEERRENCLHPRSYQNGYHPDYGPISECPDCGGVWP